MFCLKLVGFICLFVLLMSCITFTRQKEQNNSIKILALFKGTNEDLGLDHRLGRQILKLAINKITQLNPQLKHSIELVIYNDDSGCDHLGPIPDQVAKQFYNVQGDSTCESSAQMLQTNQASSSCQNNHLVTGSSTSNDLKEYLISNQLTVSRANITLKQRRNALSPNRIDAILASGCDQMIDLVGRMAAYWRVPIFTTTSISSEFSRKDTYPTMTRLSPSIDHLSSFVVRLLEEFSWRHISILVDPNQIESRLLRDNLDRTIERVRFNYRIERKLFTFQPTKLYYGSVASSSTINNNNNNNNSSEVNHLNSDASSCTNELKQTLLEVQKYSRVLLLLIQDSQTIRRILLCAWELQMSNGEYTFLALNLGLKSGTKGGASRSSASWLNTTSAKAVTTTNSDDSMDQQAQEVTGGGSISKAQAIDWFLPDDEANNLRAKQMFESLMLFSVELPVSDEYQYFVEQTLELVQQNYPESLFDRSSVSPVAVALHDSLVLAVEAIKRSHLRQTKLALPMASKSGNILNVADGVGGNPKADTDDIKEEQQGEEEEEENEEGNVSNLESRAVSIWDERLDSSIGLLVREMHINKNGDQELDYILSDLEPELGQMRPVALYSRELRQIQMLPNSYIHWPARYNAQTNQLIQNDSAPPPDEPECGFQGLADHCVDRQNFYAALVLTGSLSIVLFAIALTTWLRYKQIKYQMSLDDYWWKLDWSELEFVRLAGSAIGSGKSQSSALMGAQHCAGSVVSSVARHIKSSQAVASHGGGGAGSLVGRRKSGAGSAHNSVASSGLQASLVGGGHNTGRRPAVPLILAPDNLLEIKKREKSTAGSIISGGGGGDNLSVTTSTSGAPTPHGTQKSLMSKVVGGQQQQQRHQLTGGGTSSFLQAANNSACMIRSEFSTVVRVSSLALYKKELVIVKQLNATKSTIDITRSLLIELKGIRELMHENLAKFVGLCVEPPLRLAIVYEFCSRGSLQELLLNESVHIDWNLKCSIIGDIVNGLNFIHTSLFDFHGRLKSTNLVLDSRFTVKLTDFGLRSLYNQLDLIEDRSSDENDDDDDDDNDENEEENDENKQATNGASSAMAQPLDQRSMGAGGESDFRRMSTVTQTVYNMDSVSIRAEKINSRGAGGGYDGQTQMGSSNQLGLHQHSSGGRQMRAQNFMQNLNLKNRGSARFFWTAPEHLRERHPHLAGSKRGDIYALGIILFEILTRREPYYYGTTARPNWPTIKREQRRNRTASHLANDTTGPTGQTANSGAISEMLGRQARQAYGRMQQARRSRASVGPFEGTGGAGGGTVRSVQSGRSSKLANLKHQQQQQPVSINISSASPIDEYEDEQEHDEQLAAVAMVAEQGEQDDELMSIHSNATPTRRPVATSASGASRNRRASMLGGGGDQRGRPSNEPSDKWATLDAAEILDQLRMGIQPDPIRPFVPNHLLNEIERPKLIELMQRCWSESQAERPSVVQLRSQLRRITKGATAKNYLDNLLERLQSYTQQLEQIVDTKSADVLAEKSRTEDLLYQLLPKFVADKLKRNETIVPQMFDGVTVFFSDIVGFEKYASIMSPCELVDFLNNIYSSFESIISSFDVTKIEVILDQFLVAGGISLEESANQQANAVVVTAVAAAAAAAAAESSREGEETPANKEKNKHKVSLKRLRGSKGTTSGSKDSQKNQLKRQQSVDESGRKQQQVDQSVQQASNGIAETNETSDYFRRASAEQIARMALCIRDLVRSFHFRHQPQTPAAPSAEQEPADNIKGNSNNLLATTTFNIRIGIHSGKVCAGIVGLKRPKYCLIGDTVNVASRMHTNSKANRIQISAATRDLLKQIPGFKLEPRGRIEVKGKGMMETFWLESSY